MGRGDIMMTSRKRLGWGHVFVVLGLFAALYVLHGTFFRRSAGPLPPANIATVGDAVQREYEALGADFRERVPLAEFAGMFHRMADPDAGDELPRVRQASAADGTGPELPVARFRVEYPSTKAQAEYHFARVEGIWQLQSFTRVPADMPPGWTRASTPARGGQGRAAAPKKPSKPPAPGPAATEAPAPAATYPRTPCDYIIQPGDTLGAISMHFYGTTRYWRRIMEANPGLSERRLRVGRKIRIPSNPDAPPLEPKADAGAGARPGLVKQ